MGELNQFNLNRFITLFGCNIFIETGTGIGTGLSYALTFPFSRLYSTEIIESLYIKCCHSIKNDRCVIQNRHSVDFLANILSTFSSTDRVLFWLDAHFPGADFQLGKYIFDDDNMPLKKELAEIAKHRDFSRDVFIIDDLRLYEDGSYELGNFDIGKTKSGISFIHDFFDKTHILTKDYRHQGFMILTPKLQP